MMEDKIDRNEQYELYFKNKYIRLKCKQERLEISLSKPVIHIL